MLYKKIDYIKFSIIYSKITNEIYSKQIINPESLYLLFFLSLEKNINIFTTNTATLENLIQEVTSKLGKENTRINITKRIKELNLFFRDNKNIFMDLENKAQHELDLCKLHKIEFVTFNSNRYPSTLKKIKKPPFILYYKGYLPTDNELKRSIAVIGSRNPDTKYGKEVARRVGKTLSQHNWWNISGLALGCDEYSHRGSLEGKGLTGAILGHGLAKNVYPKQNKVLSQEILKKNGFLMSELPPSTPLSPVFLTLRNRIQSGLTRGVFLVQTPKTGGSLITVRHSLEQGKDLYIWDPSSIEGLKGSQYVEGNIKLIKDRSILGKIPKKLTRDNNLYFIKDSIGLIKYINKNNFKEQRILKQKQIKIKF